MQQNLKRVSLIFILLTTLTACSTNKVSNNTRADTVTVVERYDYKRDITEQPLPWRLVTMFTLTLGNPQTYGLMQDIEYIVKDSKGRQSSILMPSSADFAVGQCLTRWYASDNSYYPRLSVADPNCKALPQEPETGWSYLNQQKTSYRIHTIAMDSWLDAPDSELVRRMGAPNASYEANGITFLTYRRGYCQKTFEIKDGLVNGYSSKGCY